MIQEAFGQIPGAKFFTNEDRPRPSDAARTSCTTATRSTPASRLDELKLLDFVPNGGHIAFSPGLRAGRRGRPAAVEMVRSRADEYVKDYAAQFIIGLREMHHICLFLYDTRRTPSRDDTLRALQATGRARPPRPATASTAPTTPSWTTSWRTFNWGDGALLKFHETIKDALDPNGIIAPGKSGRLAGQVPRTGVLTRQRLRETHA